MPRLRKSTKEHLLQGTEPQHGGGAEDDTGIFVAGRPKMPRDFAPAEEAEWKRMVKQLVKRGTVTPIDASALEVYCRLYAAWRLAMDCGNLKQAAQLATQLRMYQKEFSATPASRENTKPAAAPPAKEKPKLGPDGRPLIFV